MKIEIINFGRKQESAVNLSGIVGYAGKNDEGDVYLIQGLFKYISAGLYPGAVGLGGEYNIPEISGKMDSDTYSAISQFQVVNAGSLLMQWFDGRFHPASYKNRHIRSGNHRYMSITLLHIMATDAAVMQGHYSYTQGLAQLDPKLAYYIDMAVIA